MANLLFYKKLLDENKASLENSSEHEIQDFEVCEEFDESRENQVAGIFIHFKHNVSSGTLEPLSEIESITENKWKWLRVNPKGIFIYLV